MAKYKICFFGFAYVEANSEDEAMEKFDDDDYIYAERSIQDSMEVEEFAVRF